MAAIISNIRFPFFCFLLAASINLSSSEEYSGLLSRLYKKAAQNNRPLILVLDNSRNGKHQDVSKIKSYQSSAENDDRESPLTYLFNMAQSQKKTSVKNRPSKLKHSRDIHENKDVDKHNHDKRHERLRSEDPKDSKDKRDDMDRIDNKILKSPVIKSFLRMANGLRCQARSECEDKCDSKHDSGKKLDACEDQCDQKFECEEEEKDPCNDTDNECSAETPSDYVSTKGVPYIERAS